MPRLQSFELTVKTGVRGLDEPPRYAINGFTLGFDEVEGGTGPGDTAKAVGAPASFPHSLILCGPSAGAWDIEGITATYYPFGEEPYTIRFGPASLDDQSDLNIWQDRPPVIFDV